MRKLLIGLGAAVAVAGCNVNVTSNDADTRNALNTAAETAEDFGNAAGNFASDAGDVLSNAAESAGQEVQDLGNRVGDVNVDVNTDGDRNGATGNKQ